MIWWVLLLGSVAYLVYKRLPVWRQISRELDEEKARTEFARKRPLVSGNDRRELPTADRKEERAPPIRPAEEFSVVLRRQVPVRFDQSPRSWLGGLPMMPGHIEWPRGLNPEKPGDGARPLHFVAQISCEDLPARLWNGLGPRQGWLLFFIDSNNCYPESNETYRVIHTDELGAERMPPEDIGPVHDGVYTGNQFDGYLALDQVPSVWRRWPVDLVEVPNELHTDGPRSFGTPPDFARTLYPGAEIAEGHSNAVSIEPFSWRCLTFGIDRAESSLSADPDPKGYIQKMKERLLEPGMFEDIVPALDRRETEVRAKVGDILDGPDPDDLGEEVRDWRLGVRRRAAERQQVRDRVAAIVAEHPSAASLLAFLDREAEGLASWKRNALAPLAALKSEIEVQGPDIPLNSSTWQDLKSTLDRESHTYWALAWGRSEAGKLPVTIEQRTVSLFSFMKGAIEAGTPKVAADYYVDRQRRALVPDKVVKTLEPYWRQLHDNRPHRMGGYHDGVQSDALPGSTGELLLLQLATDYALQWCWGDAGAYYAFIKSDALEDGAVDQAVLSLECH